MLHVLVAVVLFASSACAQMSMPMQEYQLAIMADNGAYCSVYNPPEGSGMWIVQCNQKQLPQVASFNIMPRDNFSATIVTRMPLSLAMRPGPPSPAGLLLDGLVYANLTSPAARFSLELIAGTANLTVPFGQAGTQLLYLTAVRNNTRMYCRVNTEYPLVVNASYTATIPNALRCDQTSASNASMFTIKPLGWSWLSKRVMFKNVKSNMTCGNTWFTPGPTYITCDDGKSAKAGQEWRDDMATNVMRMPMLPTRSKAEFMIQSWIEYPLPVSVWVTDLNGYLQAGNFVPSTRPRAPPGDLPYLSMLKVDGPTRNATIGSGDRVMLRSSRNGKYCMVDAMKHHQVHCMASLYDVQCLSDRSAYQFIYMEIVPSEEGMV